ncbi:hypothetical protein R2R70_22925, partial [Cobetia sp. SIMBA_158]|uniref:hypothetical protein n=1 Tax=Cobetia sp. SIMBA_158 TaxID=3081617 RepID=UPI003980D0E0
EFLNNHYDESCIVDFDNGLPIVSLQKFDKQQETKIQPLKDCITSEEALLRLNNALLESEWIKYADGSYSKWEMESLSF